MFIIIKCGYNSFLYIRSIYQR